MNKFNKKPNILLLGIDSLRRDHMSMYGYKHLTTPNMDNFMKDGVIFNNCFSPSIPTTSGYASMLTGMDVFGTDVVALRHEGPMGDHISTMAEVLGKEGYNTSCIGFTGNPASKGFNDYLDFNGWGTWAEGRSHKAENLNAVAIPEIKKLAKDDKPFFMLIRHMDPHAPYLPPQPYERIFYDKDELDKSNKSLEPVYEFKPFCDFFTTWFKPDCTDKDYVIAQYDGAIAYMDACIQNIFTTLEDQGILENTIVIITSDHGETLYDHECWFDHHGLYDCTLVVPLAIRFPEKMQKGLRIDDSCQLKDIMPTLMDILGIDTGINFNGRSLLSQDEACYAEPEFYITECTWMRKHGWRTPEWKLIHALEPDFHFKPEIELYNLIKDPNEDCNVADDEPEIVAVLEQRMQKHITNRETATGRSNPIYSNLNWHGMDCGAFKTSQQAYDTMHIGGVNQAKKLQEKLAEEEA